MELRDIQVCHLRICSKIAFGRSRAYSELEEEVDIADPFLASFEIVEPAGIWMLD